MSTTASVIITGGNGQSRLAAVNSLIDNFSPVTMDSKNPDLIFLNTEEQSIGVDEIRIFQKELSIKPWAHKIKVGIISPAGKLTKEAQNSLLKTLEEPPQNTKIFLLCHQESDLLSTIISRCQIVTLPDPKQVLAPEDSKKYQQNLKIIFSDSLGSKFKLAAEVSKDRKEALAWLDKLLIYLHNSLPNLSNWPQIWRSRQISAQSAHLTNFREIFEAKKRLKASSNVRLTIENLFLNW